VLPVFKGFDEDFIRDIDKWQALFMGTDPQDKDFPGKWNFINFFHKLIVIRALFTDKFSKSV